jgi:hypothetical protein
VAITFIVGANGHPLDERSLGNQFRKACRAAGVKRSAHRKIAATRAANAGATVAQFEAIFGWTGGRMAPHYTRSAERRRLAIEGMHLLANDERTSIPSPLGNSPHLLKIANEFSARARVCRGSDPRHLRLTMDGLT